MSSTANEYTILMAAILSMDVYERNPFYGSNVIVRQLGGNILGSARARRLRRRDGLSEPWPKAPAAIAIMTIDDVLTLWGGRREAVAVGGIDA
jgi:hypothetical protein